MNAYTRTGARTACMLVAALGLWAAADLPALAQGMGKSSLSFTPSELSVAPGATASAKVAVALSSGATWGTNLEATDAPKGLDVSFNPSSGDPAFESTMTVQAASSVKPGEYTVKIEATGDDPSAATPYKVEVK
ncbi:MAG: hypothetical protein ACREFJ_18920 [Acetobacteraceae bacterium]